MYCIIKQVVCWAVFPAISCLCYVTVQSNLIKKLVLVKISQVAVTCELLQSMLCIFGLVYWLM